MRPDQRRRGKIAGLEAVQVCGSGRVGTMLELRDVAAKSQNHFDLKIQETTLGAATGKK